MATLYIRNMDQEAAARIRTAARVREISLAEYVARLSQLHEVIRTIADRDSELDIDKAIAYLLSSQLNVLGLETVVG